MKKTISISISNRQFYVEEDAYQKLDNYLSSIKDHFKDNVDKNEILNDIEERIAEHFAEYNINIISLANVETLINTMGTVEQFDTEETATPTKEEDRKKLRQLFRDTDDMIIAGVSSGLGHYFGIDPVIFRVIFVASIFIGGAGILIYIILWIIVPEAKTTSQKLAMNGEPVTIETLSEKVQEKISEIKNNKYDRLRRLIASPFKLIGKIIQLFVRIIPKILKVFLGGMLIIVGILGLVSVMIASGFFMSGNIMIFPDITLGAFIPGLLLYIILIGISLSLLLPALFVFLGGVSLLKKKNIISAPLGFSILGIWLIAIFISGFGIAKMINGYENMKSESPIYDEIVSSKKLDNEFHKVVAKNGVKVNMIESPESFIEISGSQKNIEMIETNIIDDTLVINKKYEDKNNEFCIFCFINPRSVNISLHTDKALSKIEISDGSYLSGVLPKTKSVHVDILNGSNANLSLKTENLTTVISRGSSLTLKGNTTKAEFTLKNGSHLDAKEFEVINGKINVSSGSNAFIFVQKTLEAISKNGSNIFYEGNPLLKKEVDSGSNIRQESI